MPALHINHRRTSWKL